MRKIIPVVCLLNRQEEDAVGGVIAAVRTIVRVSVIDNRCRRDRALLAGRKGGIQEIVPGIIGAVAPARIRGRAVAVKPRAYRAGFPGYVFQLRVILEHFKVLVGKQEQLPVCVGQHPPLDGVSVIAAGSVAALLISAKIDIVRLFAADVVGAAAHHELDRLAGICGKGSRRQHGHHQTDCEQDAYPSFRSVFHR